MCEKEKLSDKQEVANCSSYVVLGLRSTNRSFRTRFLKADEARVVYREDARILDLSVKNPLRLADLTETDATAALYEVMLSIFYRCHNFIMGWCVFLVIMSTGIFCRNESVRNSYWYALDSSD